VRVFAFTVILTSVVPSSTNMWILPIDIRVYVRNYFAVSLVFRTVIFSTTQDISSVCNELETVKYGMNLVTFWFRMFTVKPDARKQSLKVLNEYSNSNHSRTLAEYLNGL